MKLCLLLIILTAGNYQNYNTDIDFYYRLSSIVQRFKEKAMDEYECKRLMGEISILSEDINKDLSYVDQGNQIKIKELNQLKFETKAIEEFIGCVSRIANYSPDIESFNLANNRFNAEIVTISKDTFCVDIISISIGNYTAYLAVNRSTNNVKFKYKLIDYKGNLVGMGESGLWHNCIRCIHNNRDESHRSLVQIKEITCEII